MSRWRRQLCKRHNKRARRAGPPLWYRVAIQDYRFVAMQRMFNRWAEEQIVALIERTNSELLRDE